MQGKPRMLVRKRIFQKLENIFNYPLSIVHAPIGYGKTTAVQQYLDQCGREADVIWVALAGGDGSAEYLWSHIAEALPAGPARRLLEENAFPREVSRRAQMAEELAACRLEKPLVVVLDDFQAVEDPAVFELVKLLAQRRLRALSIVLITRDLSRLDAAGLYQKQLCFTLTEKALRFTAEETGRYFAAAGCEVSEQEIEWISRYTEGWISMIYVLLKNVQRGLPVGKSNTINDIIEQNLYSRLAPAEKETLCRLSFLPSFTVSMALYVLGDSEGAYTLQALLKEGTFIVYSEWEKTYHIRNLLREFLEERTRFDGMDFHGLYRRAGEWFLREERYSEAFEYLYRAGETDMILERCNRENAPVSLFTRFGRIQELFASLTEEQCLRYPLACLQYIRVQLLTDGEPGSIGRWRGELDKIERIFRGSSLARRHKNFLLGELNVVRTVASFNDIRAMAACAERAAELFAGGCSCIVTRHTEASFGSPHLLYSYYQKPGGLLAAVQDLADNSERLSAPVDGCGTGSDAVAQTEYLLEIGDFERMEQSAYKAIYKTRAAQQTSLTLCARFALARLEILRATGGNSQGLESIREEVEREESPVLNTAYEMCVGYLNALLERYDEIPAWIREGDLSKAAFYNQSRNFYHTVRAKAILLSGDCIRLEAECELALRQLEQAGCQLGLLHELLCLALARVRLKGMEAGCAVLGKALEIGRADGIVMPFVECAASIGPMLGHLRRQCQGAQLAYLEKLLLLGEAYKRRVDALNADRVTLTDREQEVLQLLAQGCKHEEIGAELFISVATVRYHIKNIYRKLNVNNRVLAIQKAQALKLLG